MNNVPTHARESLSNVHYADNIIEGQVVCSCGSTSFCLLYSGTTTIYNGQKIPCSIETDTGVFFVIKARCRKCEKEHLLFDSGLHGWDVKVCPELGKNVMIPRPESIEWECVKCKQGEHAIKILFCYGSEEDVTEAIEEGLIDNPADAFEWIYITIECLTCGLVSEKWVDYETA